MAIHAKRELATSDATDGSSVNIFFWKLLKIGQHIIAVAFTSILKCRLRAGLLCILSICEADSYLVNLLLRAKISDWFITRLYTEWHGITLSR